MGERRGDGKGSRSRGVYGCMTSASLLREREKVVGDWEKVPTMTKERLCMFEKEERERGWGFEEKMYRCSVDIRNSGRRRGLGGGEEESGFSKSCCFSYDKWRGEGEREIVKRNVFSNYLYWRERESEI